MHYLGGKARLGKHIVPFLTARLSGEGRFIEPFVGAFNIVPRLRKEVPSLPGQRIYCGDVHEGLITMYRTLRDGTFDPPTELSEERWYELRRMQDWSDPVTAFAAFGCSFMGMAFSSYAKDGSGTNYAARTRRSLLKKREAMSGVNFYLGSFDQARPRSGDVVYADPPYINTAGYEGTPPMNYERFYSWCEEAAAAGAAVFVSEFTIPDRPGWTPIWSVERSALKGAVKTDYLIEVKA